jgi:hypothetical protein
MARTKKDAPPHIRFGFEKENSWWSKEDLPKKRKRVDTEWHWLCETPSWWTNLFMNRPQRRKFRRLEREIQKIYDIDELEDIVEPESGHKPHHYYW